MPAFAPSSGSYWTGAIEEWTCPAAGSYRIRAVGATGGSSSGGTLGGRGADVAGDFDLVAGEVLKVLVGKTPGQATGGAVTGAGGGMSAVARKTGNVPLVVAGGGGAGTNAAGINAQPSAQGTSNTTAANGASFTANGTGDSWVSGTAVAYSFVNGGKGGGPGQYANYGGFGGGGCTHGNVGTDRPGGGGYLGGASVGGAGAGSFNAGANKAEVLGPVATVAGVHGLVEITANNAPPTVTDVVAPAADADGSVRVSWTYTDADGNPQVQYEVGTRPAGSTGAFALLAPVTSAAAFRDFAAGTFLATTEVQVRVSDGQVWSAPAVGQVVVAAGVTRLRALFQNGSLSAEATAAATTLSSAGFATLPPVDVEDELLLVLDPGGVSGAPEVVRVVAHATGATTVKVVRGGEGTVARLHPTATRWAHTTVPSDMNQLDVPDTRSTVEYPQDFARALERRDFKTGAVLGLPAGFCQLVTRSLWANDSGGGAHQTAYHSNGLVYWRYGTRATGWAPWAQENVVQPQTGWQLLQTVTPGAVAAQTIGGVAFVNIPDWPRRLKVVSRNLNTAANASGHMNCRFNADASSLYSGWMKYHTSGTESATSHGPQTFGFAAYNYLYTGPSYGPGDLELELSDIPGQGSVWWAKQTSPTGLPSVPYGSQIEGYWHSPAPVSRIDLWTSYTAVWTPDTRFVLYGSADE